MDAELNVALTCRIRWCVLNEVGVLFLKSCCQHFSPKGIDLQCP